MIWWTSIVVVGVILLKRDSLCQGLKLDLKETSLTAKEGSCVKIGCTFKGIQSDDRPTQWLWYKDATYNDSISNYVGTVVYSSDSNRPTHQDFEGRAKYVGDDLKYCQAGSCDVNICCLRVNDNGSYGFRFEDDREANWFYTEPSLKLEVKENLCKVNFEATQTDFYESAEVTFSCYTSTLCQKKPSINGLREDVRLNGNSTSTVATFKIKWSDNQRNLTCYMPGESDNCLPNRSVTLNVKYSPRKPNLTMTMSRVELGGSLTLTCSAMANPSPLTYTWFFHQATHSPGWPNETVNNMLRLQPITRAHQGHYNCSATNTLGRGENSNSQFVEVLFAPYRPVLTLVNVTTEGNVITIGCSVESWPPSSLNLSWSSATDPSRHHLLHHVSNTTSLNTELNVTSAMAGRYTCRAQNSQGSNHSEQMLEVNYAPQNVSVKVQPCCEVPEDERLDLFCEARSVPAVINYTWTRTSAGRTVDVGFKQNLTIKSATPADRGGYRCSAENKLGSRESPEVRVEVKYDPKQTNITRLNEDENDGDVPIHLSCSSDSFPAATIYRWYRKFESNEEHFSDGQNLTINPDQPGIYKCYASNGQAGTYSDEFVLVKKGQQNVVFWASPLVCIHVVVVNAYLVYRYKRKKLVSDGAPDHLPSPVTGSADAHGSRDDLLLNHTPSHTDHASSCTGHASSNAPQCSGMKKSSSISNTVYSVVNIPTGTQQPIREDHGYANNDVNYASLHFAIQGLNPRGSLPAAGKNDVYAKITTKNYENLKEDDDDLEDIELNYCKVTFTAKQKTGETKKTTSRGLQDEEE